MIRMLLMTLVAATNLSGCTHSQQNLKDIGQYADQGDYVAVAWRSTMGVFISGVVDVVSVGGSLTPEEAEEFWTPIAETAAQSSSTSDPPSESSSQGVDMGNWGDTQQQEYALPEPQPAPAPAIPTETQQVSMSNNGQTESSNQIEPRTYQNAVNCVRRDSKSNQLGDFWENHCGFPVWIMWLDSGSCSQGCSVGPISPGKKEVSTKQKGSSIYAACEYPGTPKEADHTQWRGGNFKCI